MVPFNASDLANLLILELIIAYNFLKKRVVRYAFVCHLKISLFKQSASVVREPCYIDYVTFSQRLRDFDLNK